MFAMTYVFCDLIRKAEQPCFSSLNYPRTPEQSLNGIEIAMWLGYATTLVAIQPEII
jgi:hypothetical protein